MIRPEVYTKYSELQRRDNEYILDNYLKLIRWRRSAKILDIGSGDGETTLEVLEPRLPPDYAKLIGCDLQEDAVKYSKESNKKSKVDFFQLDIGGDKIPSRRYDHIFSSFVFHWVSNLRRALKNVYDLLVPGGDMLIHLVAKVPYYELLQKQWEDPRWTSYFNQSMIPNIHNYKRPEKYFETLLSESGFPDIQICTEERNFSYNNWLHCLKSLLAIDPIFAKLDMESKEEYMVDFFFRLKEIFSDYEEDNGAIRMPYTLLVIYASKPEYTIG